MHIRIYIYIYIYRVQSVRGGRRRLHGALRQELPQEPRVRVPRGARLIIISCTIITTTITITMYITITITMFITVRIMIIIIKRVRVPRGARQQRARYIVL